MKKRYYEVALMRIVEGSEYDYETIEYIECLSYRDGVRIAKEMSSKWDGCNVECYMETDDCTHEILWKERYENGKKKYRR